METSTNPHCSFPELDYTFTSAGAMAPAEALVCLARELKDHLLASPPPQGQIPSSPATAVGQSQKGKRKQRPAQGTAADAAGEVVLQFVDLGKRLASTIADVDHVLQQYQCIDGS